MTATDATADTASAPAGRAEKLRGMMRNPLLMGAYMGAKFPSALFGGLRIDHIDVDRCDVSVPYGWRSRNPFRSTYFAVQAMAGELSTGALVLSAVEDHPASIATVITSMEASFTKKATRRATFRCDQGAEVLAAAERAAGSDDPVEVTLDTVGTLSDGTVVSRMRFTWSLRRRAS